MNDLDLSSLATGPAPVLAPASSVRARGEQRTRRTRASVAAAAALVVAASAGTAIALSSAGKPDALVPADPTGTVTGVGYASAFPTTRELKTADGADWVAQDPALVKLVDDRDYCTQAPSPNTARSGAARPYNSGDRLMLVTILEFRDEAAARKHLQKEPEAIKRCPHRVNSAPGTSTTDSELQAQDADGYRAQATNRECTQPQSCITTVDTWDVRVTGRYIVGTSLLSADTNHFTALAGIVSAGVSQRLSACQPASCDPSTDLRAAVTPTPSTDPFSVAPDRLLSEADAAAASPGQWLASPSLPAPGAPLVGCAPGDSEAIAGQSASLVRGGETVLTVVVSVAGGTAESRVGSLREHIAQCGPASSDATYTDLGRGPHGALMVRQATSERTSVWVVVGHGSYLSFTMLPASEEARAAAWAEQAYARIATPD